MGIRLWGRPVYSDQASKSVLQKFELYKVKPEELKEGDTVLIAAKIISDGEKLDYSLWDYQPNKNWKTNVVAILPKGEKRCPKYNQCFNIQKNTGCYNPKSAIKENGIQFCFIPTNTKQSSQPQEVKHCNNCGIGSNCEFSSLEDKYRHCIDKNYLGWICKEPKEVDFDGLKLYETMTDRIDIIRKHNKLVDILEKHIKGDK